MNDMVKSFYEIAQEEYAKSKGASDAARGTVKRPQNGADDMPDGPVDKSSGTTPIPKEAIAQITAILQEQGIDPGTPEFNKWFMNAMGQGDDEKEAMSDDEMMEKEQAIQSKMMKEQ